MTVPTRALALIVVGSTGVSAWAQVDARSAGSGSVGVTADAPSPTTRAVAAFPDVVERRASPGGCPRRALLEGNPYEEAVPGRSRSPRELSATSIDDANPYGGGMPVEHSSREMAQLAKLDFANPYGAADPSRDSVPAMKLDSENPYVIDGAR